VSPYVNNPTIENLPNSQRSLLIGIEKSGIQVIKQGMLFTFVIPTDCFFSRETRMLKSHRDRDLDLLAQFVDGYIRYSANPYVSITAYTDTVWLSPARDKLSMHYAETIAAFLQEDGINSNIMTVRGRGAKNPIGSNGYPMGASFNRRVEVRIS
jgi:outer membrane protein OmpA-like peptidoglycan-associated protein